MTKDFEARALEKAREHCKEKRPLDWTLEELDAFLAGARWGREAGLDEAAEIVVKDDCCNDNKAIRPCCKALYKAWEAIRAAKGKKGTSE